jgi:hypothetical protein
LLAGHIKGDDQATRIHETVKTVLGTISRRIKLDIVNSVHRKSKNVENVNPKIKHEIPDDVTYDTFSNRGISYISVYGIP